MPPPPKKYSTAEELHAARAANARRTTEATRFKKSEQMKNQQSTSGETSTGSNNGEQQQPPVSPETQSQAPPAQPPTQPPVATSAEPAGENPSGGESAGNSGGEKVMPVPDIKEQTPFNVQPKIEDHVKNGRSDSSTPPKGKNGETSQTPEFDGNIGDANVNEDKATKAANSGTTGSQAPPFVDPNGGSTTQPPGGGGAQQPAQPSGVGMKKEQAEKQYDFICENLNKLIRDKAPYIVNFKPYKRVPELKMAPRNVQEQIVAGIDQYNRKNVEELVFSKDDIEMVRPHAVAVLQEESKEFSNKTLLIISIGHVLEGKLEVIGKIIMLKKEVVKEIRNTIRAGVDEMAGMKHEMDDILKQATAEREKADATYAETKRMYDEMQKWKTNMSSNGHFKREEVPLTNGNEKGLNDSENEEKIAA